MFRVPYWQAPKTPDSALQFLSHFHDFRDQLFSARADFLDALRQHVTGSGDNSVFGIDYYFIHCGIFVPCAHCLHCRGGSGIVADGDFRSAGFPENSGDDGGSDTERAYRFFVFVQFA